MMKVTFYCCAECKEAIEKYLDHKEISQLVVLEVNCIEDLSIEISKEDQLVVIIDNGDLIFEILELRPSVILRKSKLNQDIYLLDNLVNKSKILEFKSGYLSVRIDVDDMIYIESFGHYLEIHTHSGKFVVRDRLRDVLKQVEGFDFRQIHKSYIVNMKYVEMMNNQICVLNNKTELKIGRKYKNR